MSTRRLSSTHRKNLIRLASELPRGSKERQAILAGLKKASLPKEARLPSVFLGEAQKLPEYKDLLKAVKSSKGLGNFLDSNFKRWSDRLSLDDFRDVDEDGWYAVRPTPPELDDLLKDSATYVVFEEIRDLDRPTKELMRTLVALAGKLGIPVHNEDDLFEDIQDAFLEKALMKVIKEKYGEEYWDSALDEVVYEMVDAAEYARDPDRYYGVSQRDFL